MITFFIHCNFILKPYGFTDIRLAINAVILMIVGLISALLLICYLKKTSNYQKTLMILLFANTLIFILITIEINIFQDNFLTTFLTACLGFFGTPIAFICYKLGCELVFPMNCLMVIALLNGCTFLWTFLSSSFTSLVFGFSSKDSSMLVMIVLSIFMLLSSLSFFCVKIDLKKSQFLK